MLETIKPHLFVLVLLLLSDTSSSRAQFRKYANEFLNIGVGARGLAMGGAQIASVKDGTSGYWNAAGLTGVAENSQFNGMHAAYFTGIGKYDLLSAAFPTESGKRTLGITALRFSVDDIMNTLFLVEPDGSINYNNIQSFSSADYAFLFSCGQRISGSGKETKSLQVGTNVKLIHRSVGHFAKSWGFGLDAGVQYWAAHWQFAAVAKDLTSTFNAWVFRFSDKEKEMLYLANNDIPVRSTELTAPRLILGLSRKFQFGEKNSLRAEVNWELSFDGERNTWLSSRYVNVDPRLGLEWGMSKILYLRAGLNNFQKALADGDTLNQKKIWIFQPGAGVGFRLGQLVIDYAFINLANQSSPLFTHVFSLQWDLHYKEESP